MKQLVDRVSDILLDLISKNEQELVNYDVKNEWKDALVKDVTQMMQERAGSKLDLTWESISPWEKMCCYKISKMDVDCDVSLRSNIIYFLAFGQENWKIKAQDNKREKYELCSQEGIVYRGDTMNSYATTVHELLRSGVRYAEKDAFVKKVRNKYGVEDAKKGGKYEYFRMHWEACILDNYQRFKEIVTEQVGANMEIFLRLTHSVGNFIPVPVGFNKRGNLCGDIKDYWDLTLLVIWKWFFSGEKQYRDNVLLSQIVQNERITNCVQWLESYDNWDDFVDKNYLQDFVSISSESDKYGGPKLLWEAHLFVSKSVYPQIKDEDNEYEMFFGNASNWIAERGHKIIRNVKSRLAKMSEQELYDLAQKMVGMQ